MSSKTLKLVTAVCIACVAVIAILWMGINAVADREHLVPAPAPEPDGGED